MKEYLKPELTIELLNLNNSLCNAGISGSVQQAGSLDSWGDDGKGNFEDFGDF